MQLLQNEENDTNYQNHRVYMFYDTKLNFI